MKINSLSTIFLIIFNMISSTLFSQDVTLCYTRPSTTINTNYVLGLGNRISADDKLDNPANFSSTGTCGFDFQLVPLTDITAIGIANAGCNIIDVGISNANAGSGTLTTDYTNAEFAAIKTWSDASINNVIVAFQGHAGPLTGGNYSGVGTNNDNPNSFTNFGSTIFNGVFGNSLSFNQGGIYQGIYDISDPEGEVIIQDASGDPTGFIDCNNANIYLADVGLVSATGGLSFGTGIVSNTDIFYANLMCGLANIATNGNGDDACDFDFTMTQCCSDVFVLDTDGDTVPDECDLDADNDGILDTLEQNCNFINSGNSTLITGDFAENIYWLAWTGTDLVDGIDENDNATFNLPDGGTITAVFTNVTDLNVSNPGTYGTDNGNGPSDYFLSNFNTLANANLQTDYNVTDAAIFANINGTGNNNDISFNVSFSAETASGISYLPDLIFTDAENTGNNESLMAQTNGSEWQVIESVAGLNYINFGIGTDEIQISNTSGGVPILKSVNATELTITINVNSPTGGQAFALGVFLECLPIDSDNDGRPNHLDFDSDNDGIPDAVEACGNIALTLEGCRLDNNGDATYIVNANNCNLGIIENSTCTVLNNSDNDAEPDYIDLNSDNDLCPDYMESQIGDVANNTSCNIPVNDNWINNSICFCDPNIPNFDCDFDNVINAMDCEPTDDANTKNKFLKSCNTNSTSNFQFK